MKRSTQETIDLCIIGGSSHMTISAVVNILPNPERGVIDEDDA